MAEDKLKTIEKRKDYQKPELKTYPGLKETTGGTIFTPSGVPIN